MRKVFLFAIACALLPLASCGPRWDTGNITTEQKTVTDFTSIDISAPVDAVVTVKPGATPSVTLKGFPDVLKRIKTEVVDGRLRIYTDEKRWNLNFDENAKAAITVSSLSQLDLAGAADVDVIGNITGDMFSLNVAGAGDVKIDELNTDKLSVDAAGAADVSIKKGVVRSAEYDFSGAGDLKAYGLQSNDVRASVSGAGDVKLSVSQTLDASISGVGSIQYKGNPAVSKSVSGIGSVSQVN